MSDSLLDGVRAGRKKCSDHLNYEAWNHFKELEIERLRDTFKVVRSYT